MIRVHFAVLAAGRSLRYGTEDKLMEKTGGRELLFLLLDKIRKIQADWKGCTAVVLSRERNVRLDGPEICVMNRDPEKGISFSIQLALDSIQQQPKWQERDAVCFCVCDQPFLKRTTLEAMLEGFLKSGKGIGCIDRNGPKNPCVFQERYFPELRGLTGDTGGKAVLKQHMDDLFRMEAGKEEVWDMDEKKTVIVRGGGDLATGTAYLLARKGYRVLVLETDLPACIRRQVAFCEAVYEGSCTVEGMTARIVRSKQEAEDAWKGKELPVLIDPECTCLSWLHPVALVDAILAKRNLGTRIDMAPLTIGLGPGFTAGEDTDLVIETMRGESLGKIYRHGSAIPNTGVPGVIAGYAKERVIHAPCAGTIRYRKKIGDRVERGELLAVIDETPVFASLTGYLRGAIKEGYPVSKGLKIMDIDPRTDSNARCFLISDKALAVGGSVCRALEEWERTCLES